MAVNTEGAKAPFFLPACLPTRRADYCLQIAIDHFQNGRYVDALLTTEYICRHFPRASMAAFFRACVMEKILPSLGARAWLRAWRLDPVNPLFQDKLLTAWAQVHAKESAGQLGMHFLPDRCRQETHEALLPLLEKATTGVIGACWKHEHFIRVRLFSSEIAHDRQCATLILHAEGGGESRHVVPVDGNLISIPCPDLEQVWTVAVIDENNSLAATCLPGSPLVFEAGEASTIMTTCNNQSTRSHLRAGHSVTIIIPVYRNEALVRACLESVLKSLPANTANIEILVINDASPDAGVRRYLEGLFATGRIQLIVNRFNLGFIESVNRGIRACPNCDVLLLNADTQVHGNWVDRLLFSLYQGDDIASVCPWSNNGEITSLYKGGNASPPPSIDELGIIDSTIAELHEQKHIEDVVLPSSCGFAMLMRRSVIDEIGALDGAALTRGYGEEVDWCMRARQHGYRHFAATSVFVAHTGTVSFSYEKNLRTWQNKAIIHSRYPDYYDEYHKFINQDPLADVRAKIFARLRENSCDWLLLLGQQNKMSNFDALPPALAHTWNRVAVSAYTPYHRHANTVLKLARRIATHGKSGLRLLVFGFVDEPLWRTGVVDAIPSILGDNNPLLSDSVLAGISNCRYFLHLGDCPWPADYPQKMIDDTLDVEALFLSLNQECNREREEMS